MRRIWVWVLLLCLAGPAWSTETAPPSASLSWSLKPGDVTRYAVKVRVSGKTVLPDTGETATVDVGFDFVACHSVFQGGKDGSIRLDITAEDASGLASGQRIPLSQGFFEKLTALIDKDGNMTSLLPGQTTAGMLPGLNYRNLILLFRTYAPAGELKPGATWKKTVKLPPDPTKYDLNSTFEAVEDAGDLKTARVKTDIAVVPPAGSRLSARGFAVTSFSLVDGKLVKSHAEMTIKPAGLEGGTAAGGEDAATPRDPVTVVKIDISRVAAPTAKQ